VKCYTIKKGTVVDGIPVDDADGAVHVGEEGRGRQLTLFTIPEGSIVNGEPRLLMDVPGPAVAVVLLIQDHSGYRGGWALEYKGPDGGWLPVAEGRCAQGIAGAMGGGPEYLGVFTVGELTILRTGRLYSEPPTLVVRRKDNGELEVIDQNLEARSFNAGGAFQAALAKLGGAK